MSMLFCPTCSNMLIIAASEQGTNDWACQSCPYKFPITYQMTSRTRLKRKDVDDVLGTQDFGTDETSVACPKCENDRAKYRLIQIRSADEPMTRFYKCTNKECGHVWREDWIDFSAVLSHFQPLPHGPHCIIVIVYRRNNSQLLNKYTYQHIYYTVEHQTLSFSFAGEWRPRPYLCASLCLDISKIWGLT